MIPAPQSIGPVFEYRFTVPADAVDQNGHVNNVVYVQWMQDVAMRHSESAGGTAAMEEAGATWVARSHNVEYLAPAYAGEEILVLTWIAELKRATSLRRYRFLRAGDETLLVRGETQWVFIDAANGRPRKIPDDLINAFAES